MAFSSIIDYKEKHVGAFVLALACFLLVAGCFEPPCCAQTSSKENSWNAPGRCGTNVLYAFLCCIKTERIDYNAVAETVPVGRQGSSMLDLKTSASSFGLNASIRKVGFEKLEALELPFIAHLDLTYMGGDGHYLLVFDKTINSNGDLEFNCFDGGDLEVRKADIRFFEKNASGFYLVRLPSNFLLTLAWPGMAFLICFAVVFFQPRNEKFKDENRVNS